MDRFYPHLSPYLSILKCAPRSFYKFGLMMRHQKETRNKWHIWMLKKILIWVKWIIFTPNWAQTIEFLIIKICCKIFFETWTMMNHRQYKKIANMNFPKKPWFGLNWSYLPQYFCLKTVCLSIFKSTLVTLALWWGSFLFIYYFFFV